MITRIIINSFDDSRIFHIALPPVRPFFTKYPLHKFFNSWTHEILIFQYIKNIALTILCF